MILFLNDTLITKITELTSGYLSHSFNMWYLCFLTILICKIIRGIKKKIKSSRRVKFFLLTLITTGLV